MDADRFLLRAQQWGSANAEVNIPLPAVESRAKLGVRSKECSFFFHALPTCMEVCRCKFDLLNYIHVWLFLQHSSERSKANTTKIREGKTKIQS